jgi:regulator of RNase E activity RraA
VLPGDIVVGDANGVVVVPRLDAEVVLEGGRAIAAAEAKKIAEFAQGRLLPAWLAETLRQKGCETIEGVWEA